MQIRMKHFSPPPFLSFLAMQFWFKNNAHQSAYFVYYQYMHAHSVKDGYNLKYIKGHF